MQTTARPQTRSSTPSDKLVIRPSRRTDWDSYATAYDLLLAHNPAYQALMQDFADFAATLPAPRRVCDVGGGTGNYTDIAARAFPQSEVRLAEPNPGMLAVAQSKLAGLPNVTFDKRPLEEMGGTGEYDLVLCIHALYVMPDQPRRLADLRRVLRPGGLLYLVDIGRPLDVAEWRRYLFGHLVAESGMLGALRTLWQGREIASQNRLIREAQDAGLYWTHAVGELASKVAGAGFEILRQGTAYRGYSDVVVGRAA